VTSQDSIWTRCRANPAYLELLERASAIRMRIDTHSSNMPASAESSLNDALDDIHLQLRAIEEEVERDLNTSDYSERNIATTHFGKYDHSAFPMRPGGAPNMDFVRQIVEWDSKHGTPPHEPETSTDKPPRPSEPSETVEDSTIAKAATTFGSPVSRIRKLLQALRRRPIRTTIAVLLLVICVFSFMTFEQNYKKSDGYLALLFLVPYLAGIFIGLIFILDIPLRMYQDYLAVNKISREKIEHELQNRAREQKNQASERKNRGIFFRLAEESAAKSVRANLDAELRIQAEQIILARRNNQLTDHRITQNALPLPRVPAGAEDFEHLSGQWLSAWGDEGVYITPRAIDGGIDIDSLFCVSQVKFYSDKKVSRPEIQQLRGAAFPKYQNKFATFFAWANGYTQEAIDYADEAGVGLFIFDVHDLTVKACNSQGEYVISSLNDFWLERNGHHIEDTGTVDINSSDLRGANLSATSLSALNLSGTNLTDADLTNANLIGTNLQSANLFRANLSHAKLLRTNLTNADLTDAGLTEALLLSADLTNANLFRANLSHSKAIGVNLTGATLIGTNLSAADLRSANFTNANLYGADLTGTNTEKANFTGATMPDGSIHD